MIHHLKPKIRRTISMHPYLKIDKEADGTGGGIVLRVYGEGPEPLLVEVRWGESTEIEILQ